MACYVCDIDILPADNLATLACCQTRAHLGCICRRFVSGPRACPKCGREPNLPFDDPPGAVRSATTREEASVGGWFNIIGRLVSGVSLAEDVLPTDKTIAEMLDAGWAWQDMRDAGLTKDALFVRGLTLALARRHAAELKSVYGFDARDWQRCPRS